MADDESVMRAVVEYDSDIPEGVAKDKAALDSLRSSIDDHNRSLGESTKATQDLEKQLGSLRKEYDEGRVSEDVFTRSNAALTSQLETHRATTAKLSNELADLNTAYDDLRKTTGVAEQATASFEKRMKSLDNTLSSGNGGGFINRMRALGGQFGAFGSVIFGLVKAGGPLLLLGSILPTLLKSVDALGVGGFELTASWSRMSGMFIALPATVLMAAQAMGVIKLATWDVNASFTNLAKSSPAMYKTLLPLKPMLESLHETVNNRLFAGLITDVEGLGKNYLPMLQKELGKTASSLNRVAKNGISALEKPQNKGLLSSILSANSRDIGIMSPGIDNGLNVVLRLLKDAEPLMRYLSVDFDHFTKDLDKSINDKKLSNFFLSSGKQFMGMLSTASNFLKGIINIGKDASKYGDQMDSSLEKLSKKFDDWTTSPDGRKSISNFFQDMQPVLQSLGGLAKNFFQMVKNMTGSNKDTVAQINDLGSALPKLGTAVHQLGATLTPTLEALQKSGIAGASFKALLLAIQGIHGLATALDSLPSGLLGRVATVVALMALMKKASGALGGVARTAGIGGSSSFGVQKVFVVNMPTSLGGGGSGGLATDAERGAEDVAGGSKLEKFMAKSPRLAKWLGVGAKDAEGAVKLGVVGKTLTKVGDLTDAIKGSRALGVLGKTASGASRFLGPVGDVLTVGLTAYDTVKAARTGRTSAGAVIGDAAGGAAMGAGIGATAGSVIPVAGTAVGAIVGGVVGGLVGGSAPLVGALSHKLFNKSSSSSTFEKMSLDQLKGAQQKEQSKLDVVNKTIQGLKDDSSRAAGTQARQLSLQINATEQQRSSIVSQLQVLGGIIQNKSFTANVSMPSIQAPYASGFLNQLAATTTAKGRWTGGPTAPGTTYLTGERGPELWLGRNGRARMLGVNGPELAQLGYGAVVNAQATRNPWTEQSGLTPQWALETMRAAATAAMSHSGGRVLTPSSGGRQGGATPAQVMVNFGGIHARENVDVEGSVRRGIKRAMQELEERG